MFQIHISELTKRNIMLYTDDNRDIQLLTIKHSNGRSEKVYGELVFWNSTAIRPSKNAYKWIKWFFLQDKMDNALTHKQEQYVAHILERGFVMNRLNIIDHTCIFIDNLFTPVVNVLSIPFILIEIIVDIFLNMFRPRRRKKRRKKRPSNV